MSALLKSRRAEGLYPSVFCSLFHSCFIYSNGPPSGHKVTSLTVRPLCHMEKCSTRHRNVNTALVSFCSIQAFNSNSSCASTPLDPGKWKGIIQIIKSVRRGRGMVRNSANITPTSLQWPPNWLCQYALVWLLHTFNSLHRLKYRLPTWTLPSNHLFHINVCFFTHWHRALLFYVAQKWSTRDLK